MAWNLTKEKYFVVVEPVFGDFVEAELVCVRLSSLFEKGTLKYDVLSLGKHCRLDPKSKIQSTACLLVIFIKERLDKRGCRHF